MPVIVLFLVYEPSVFFVLLSSSFLSSHVLIFVSAYIYIASSFSQPTLTTTIMNVEDTELFMNPQNASKTWRGRCMWAFEDGGWPALRYGEGVDLMSERSVRVKFQALLSKKDGSYSHSRQHSIGYPIPTLHTSLTRPIQLAKSKGNLHSISSIFFMFSFLLLFLSLSHEFICFSSLFIFR
jgi:hypothetical protein